MYGVPASLDLRPFLGANLQRVDLGLHVITFHFAMEPVGRLTVEGDWELVAPDGSVLDRRQEPAERDCHRLHRIIGRDVVRYEVAAPLSFSFTFDSGHVLRVYDRSSQYESFQLEPGGIVV